MKYEISHRGSGEWTQNVPTTAIRDVLTKYPDATITMGDGSQWRVSHRDRQLIADIRHIVYAASPRTATSWSIAEEIYSLLESRDLV